MLLILVSFASFYLLVMPVGYAYRSDFLSPIDNYDRDFDLSMPQFRWPCTGFGHATEPGLAKAKLLLNDTKWVFNLGPHVNISSFNQILQPSVLGYG